MQLMVEVAVLVDTELLLEHLEETLRLNLFYLCH